MLPFSTIGEKFEDIARFGAVYALITLFFILDVIPVPQPFDGLMAVPFLTITVYYWAAYRPTLLPVLAVFILGLLLDIMGGTPIGLNAILLVLLHWAISDQRAFLSAQSFLMVWLVFCVVSTGVIIVQWAITGLVNLGWASIALLWPQMLAGIVAYPMLTILLHLIHKILPSPKMPLTSR